MILNFNAIDVTSGALTGADDSLLFSSECVKKAGFADVRATDEGDFERGTGGDF